MRGRFNRLSTLLLLLLLSACAPRMYAKSGLEPFDTAGATERAAQPKRFALIVGIDQFEDERFNDLKYTRADAEAFGRALAHYDDVRTLVGPKSTTRTAVLSAVEELARTARDPRDTVVLYLSTHGSLAQPAGGSLERYAVASDTRMDLLAETGISVEHLLRKMNSMASRRTALVLAMCHSGRGKSQLSDALARALAEQKSAPPPLHEVSEAGVVLTASAFGETARESEELEHDVYTYFLLEALGAGDRDGDGAVTASEAHDYARERTYAFTNGRQRPTSESDILGKDPIVLAGASVRVGRPVLYSYAASAEGVSVLIDGNEKGVLPGGIVVEPGDHELQLRNARSGALLYEGSIELDRGEIAELSRLISRPGMQVMLTAAGGSYLPLSSQAREKYLPPSFGAIARVGLRNWPWQGVVADLGGSLWTGSGTTPGIDETLPYTLSGIGISVGGGYALDVAQGFEIIPMLRLGSLWFTRQIESETFTREEDLRGNFVAFGVDAEWRPIEAFVVGVSLDLSLLSARLGSSHGPHPMSSASLHLGYAIW